MSILLKSLLIVLIVLISLAFLTLIERKVLSLVGLRIGPNKPSFLGILQPFSDALKISNKQTNLVGNFSFFFYYMSVFSMIFSSLFIWNILMFEPKILSLKSSVLLFFFFLSFISMSCMFSGWSIYSKYSLISTLRMVSQLISYEGVIYMIMVIFILSIFSINFYFFNTMYINFWPLIFIFWLTSLMAEMNRTPFDFSESESELVSGFNVDYGSTFFSFIFMSEYSMILFFSMMTSFMFFFFNKIFLLMFYFFIFFFFLWIRSVLPRFRYDKFLMLSWMFILPYLTLYLLFLIIFMM